MRKFILYLLLFVLLCLIHVQSNGQCVFHKLYDYNELNNGGLAVVQTSDNEFICSSSIYDGRLHIFRLDECGDTVWTKIFNYSQIGADDGYSVIQSTDGNYIICGVMTDDIDIEGDTFILKIDANGDTLWYKTIEGGYGDKGIMIKQTSDEGFIIGGVNYDSILFTSQVYLIKTDSLGEVEWQEEYGEDGHDNLKSIDITPDGGYIIGGEFVNPATSSYDLFLLKTDSAGNEQWKEYYGDAYDDGKGFAIATADSGFAIVGYTKDATGESEAYIVKTDSTGTEEWSKTYGYPDQFNCFMRIRQLEDGNYILAGDVYDFDIADGPLVWLLKMNTNGDTLWTKKYTYFGGDSHTYVEDLQLTSDGGYVMTGYTINSGNDLWLLKTDSLGNTCTIDTVTWEGCEDPVTVVEIAGYGETGSVVVYPNPSTGQITVNCETDSKAEFVLYDLTGVEVLRSFVNGQGQISLDNISGGIYLYRVVMAGERISTGKLVIVR
ncbi:MAG: T9SS type A sorting domain-containing protein [Bacteroidetes bacterium]|nr:T9SS type A sorting domain-containing protein [Bacteroidota bacterium]